MPFCSAAASALALMSSSLRSRAASSSVSCFIASATVILRSFFRPPPICWNMPWIWLVSSSMPGGAMISICGASTETSISTSRSSSTPSRSILRNFWRVAESVVLQVVEVDLARRRQQHVEQALLGVVGGAVAHLARLDFARVLDRDFDQVANDGVDVAADVAHLGELGRLDLHERRFGEARKPARDLRLADAGGPDHQDVLGRDLVAQRLGHLLPAPAVAQRDRDRALGCLLPDDVLVELGDDLFGGQLRHAPAIPVLVTSAARVARRRFLSEVGS